MAANITTTGSWAALDDSTLTMQSAYFEDILDSILNEDSRFAREAYHFVREALDFTQQKLFPPDKAESPTDSIENRHVTGQQLLDGIKEYALNNYGPMTLTVLKSWGIARSEDFGEIVFNLVDHGRGMFGKTETDTRDDFRDGYDFHEAFTAPFLPSKRRGMSARQMREA